MFYNQEYWTKKCLEYLVKNTDCDKVKIYLIDNGSLEKNSKEIESYSRLFSENIVFKKLLNRTSVGLCYNNIIKEVEEDIIFDCFVVLHNDVLVSYGWLENLLSSRMSYGDNKNLCYFPRTNYSNENTPSVFDEDLKEIFLKNKYSNKKRQDENMIQDVLIF